MRAMFLIPKSAMDCNDNKETEDDITQSPASKTALMDACSDTRIVKERCGQNTFSSSASSLTEKVDNHNVSSEKKSHNRASSMDNRMNPSRIKPLKALQRLDKLDNSANSNSLLSQRSSGSYSDDNYCRQNNAVLTENFHAATQFQNHIDSGSASSSTSSGKLTTWKDMSPTHRCANNPKMTSSSGLNGSRSSSMSRSLDSTNLEQENKTAPPQHVNSDLPKNMTSWKTLSPNRSFKSPIGFSSPESSDSDAVHSRANRFGINPVSGSRNRLQDSATGSSASSSPTHVPRFGGMCSSGTVSSPDDASNDYFYDEDFQVRFDSNIRESCLETEAQIDSTEVFELSSTYSDGYCEDSLFNGSSTQPYDSEVSTSCPTSATVSTSDRDMMCSSDLIDLSDGPLFTPTPTSEIPALQSYSTDSLDSRMRNLAAGLASSMDASLAIVTDCAVKKENYMLSYWGDSDKKSSTEASMISDASTCSESLVQEKLTTSVDKNIGKDCECTSRKQDRTLTKCSSDETESSRESSDYMDTIKRNRTGNNRLTSWKQIKLDTSVESMDKQKCTSMPDLSNTQTWADVSMNSARGFTSPCNSSNDEVENVYVNVNPCINNNNNNDICINTSPQRSLVDAYRQKMERSHEFQADNMDRSESEIKEMVFENSSMSRRLSSNASTSPVFKKMNWPLQQYIINHSSDSDSSLDCRHKLQRMSRAQYSADCLETRRNKPMKAFRRSLSSPSGKFHCHSAACDCEYSPEIHHCTGTQFPSADSDTIVPWLGTKNFSSQFPPNTRDCGIQTSVLEKDASQAMLDKELQTSPDIKSSFNFEQFLYNAAIHNTDRLITSSDERNFPLSSASSTNVTNNESNPYLIRQRRGASLSPVRPMKTMFYSLHTHRSLPDLSFLATPRESAYGSGSNNCSSDGYDYPSFIEDDKLEHDSHDFDWRKFSGGGRHQSRSATQSCRCHQAHNEHKNLPTSHSQPDLSNHMYQVPEFITPRLSPHPRTGGYKFTHHHHLHPPPPAPPPNRSQSAPVRLENVAHFQNCYDPEYSMCHYKQQQEEKWTNEQQQQPQPQKQSPQTKEQQQKKPEKNQLPHAKSAPQLNLSPTSVQNVHRQQAKYGSHANDSTSPQSAKDMSSYPVSAAQSPPQNGKSIKSSPRQITKNLRTMDSGSSNSNSSCHSNTGSSSSSGIDPGYNFVDYRNGDSPSFGENLSKVVEVDGGFAYHKCLPFSVKEEMNNMYDPYAMCAPPPVNTLCVQCCQAHHHIDSADLNRMNAYKFEKYPQANASQRYYPSKQRTTNEGNENVPHSYPLNCTCTHAPVGQLSNLNCNQTPVLENLSDVDEERSSIYSSDENLHHHCHTHPSNTRTFPQHYRRQAYWCDGIPNMEPAQVPEILSEDDPTSRKPLKSCLRKKDLRRCQSLCDPVIPHEVEYEIGNRQSAGVQTKKNHRHSYACDGHIVEYYIETHDAIAQNENVLDVPTDHEADKARETTSEIVPLKTDEISREVIKEEEEDKAPDASVTSDNPGNEMDTDDSDVDKKEKRKSVSFASEVSFRSPANSPQTSPKKNASHVSASNTVDPISSPHAVDGTVALIIAADGRAGSNKLAAMAMQKDSMSPRPPPVPPHHHPERGPQRQISDDGSISSNEGAPSEFEASGQAADYASVSGAMTELERKTVYLADVSRAAEQLVMHFAKAKEPFHKLRLGTTTETPEIGHLILSLLCPAVARIIGEGLKPFSSGLQPFGRVHMTVWRVAELSVDEGPATIALQELVRELRGRADLMTTRQRFEGFVFGLLNLRLLDCWIGYIRRKDSVMRRLYDSHSILWLSHHDLQQTYDDMLLSLQPLAILPFQLDYRFIITYHAELLKRDVALQKLSEGREFMKGSISGLSSMSRDSKSVGEFYPNAVTQGLPPQSDMKHVKSMPDMRAQNQMQPPPTAPRESKSWSFWNSGQQFPTAKDVMTNVKERLTPTVSKLQQEAAKGLAIFGSSQSSVSGVSSSSGESIDQSVEIGRFTHNEYKDYKAKVKTVSDLTSDRRFSDPSVPPPKPKRVYETGQLDREVSLSPIDLDTSVDTDIVTGGMRTSQLQTFATLNDEQPAYRRSEYSFEHGACQTTRPNSLKSNIFNTSNGPDSKSDRITSWKEISSSKNNFDSEYDNNASSVHLNTSRDSSGLFQRQSEMKTCSSLIKLFDKLLLPSSPKVTSPVQNRWSWTSGNDGKGLSFMQNVSKNRKCEKLDLSILSDMGDDFKKTSAIKYTDNDAVTTTADNQQRDKRLLSPDSQKYQERVMVLDEATATFATTFKSDSDIANFSPPHNDIHVDEDSLNHILQQLPPMASNVDGNANFLDTDDNSSSNPSREGMASGGDTSTDTIFKGDNFDSSCTLSSKDANSRRGTIDSCQSGFCEESDADDATVTTSDIVVERSVDGTIGGSVSDSDRVMGAGGGTDDADDCDDFDYSPFRVPEYRYVKAVHANSAGCTLTFDKGAYLEVIAQIDDQLLYCVDGNEEGLVMIDSVCPVSDDDLFDSLHGDFYS